METKEQLVNNIKEWIKIDTEITQLKSDIKERNNKKKALTENLVTVMKSNKIDCFDINGGALVYKTSKVKKPINGKSLLAALQNYYKSDAKMAEAKKMLATTNIKYPDPAPEEEEEEDEEEEEEEEEVSMDENEDAVFEEDESD